MSQNSGTRILRLADGASPPTEQEAEAKLHHEGYECFRWHDVPGAEYPRHRHEYDECLWILKGSITFAVEETEYTLNAGDRFYLPALVHHTAIVPHDQSVTYLVGQRKPA